jgi:hypothetical protein
MSLYNVRPSTPIESFRLTASSWSDHQGPTVCRACGCRLEPATGWYDNDGESVSLWRHFAGAPGRDARGCLVECADLSHAADGTPLI